jgi:hypothetical protein
VELLVRLVIQCCGDQPLDEVQVHSHVMT